jgi:tetratricopeptide (TPR) repeat protein
MFHLLSFLFLSATIALLIAPDRTLACHRLVVYAGGGLVFALAVWGGRKPHRLLGASILLLLAGVAAALLSLVVTDWSAGELGLNLPLSEQFPTLLHLPGSGVPNPAQGANPRMVSGTMALFLPLAFSLGLFAKQTSLRLLGGLAGLVMLLPLYLSQSPQGLLALALGLGLVLAWHWPWSMLPQAALALLATWAWYLWHWGLPPALVQRLLVGVQARIQIWSIALMMIRDMPFSGSGLNNFPTVMPLYDFSLEPQAHAHNVFLQTATDLGLIGLAAFAALFGTAFYIGWQAYRHYPDLNLRAAVAGCAGGCAAYLGYGLWDSMTLGNLPALAVWAMLGLLLAAGRLCPQLSVSHSQLSQRQKMILLSGSGAFALLTLPIWVSALLVNAGRALYNPSALHAVPPKADHLEEMNWLAYSAARLYPSNVRACLLLGLLAVLNGEDLRARMAFEQGIALEPTDRQAQLALANTCYRLGETACAVEHWRLAGAHRELLNRGQVLYKADNYPAAEAWFQLAVQVDPGNSDGWLRWIAVLKAQAKWQAAERAARAFAQRFPKLSLPYEELANALLQLKQPEDAWQVVETGFALVPKPGAQLYYLRSRLAAERQDYLAAEADAIQAIALQPTSGLYLAWLGDIYMRQERYDAALAQYERAARNASSPDWMWRADQYKGSLYAAQGWWSEAVAAYTRAVSLGQEQGATSNVLAQNYALLGNILLRSGDLTGAEVAYRQALQLNPQNSIAQKGFAELVHK